MTEIFICILVFQLGCRGEWGQLLLLKIVKKYEFAMAYFILKASISTAGKTLKQVQREQIESLLGV